MKFNEGMHLPAYPLFVKDPYFSIWTTTDKLNEILDFSKNIENLSQEQSIILVKSIENLLNNPVIKDKIVRKVYNSIMSDKELLGGIIERVYSGIISDDYKMQSITGRVGYLGAFESNPITYHYRHTHKK